jgi:hypothetical protein
MEGRATWISLLLLAWAASGCSACSNEPLPDAGSEDGGTLEDGGIHDGGLADSGFADSGFADGGISDSGLADSGITDGGPPAAPHCNAGDRTEWSGSIPNTLMAVSVCSTCDGSYVVAANGSASSGEVTVDNASTTVTAPVPGGGTATTAILADNPTDGTVTVCGTAGAHGCLPVSPQNQEYCNPYRAVASLVPQRIDQGVDYCGAGPIYAIGPGTIDLYNNRNDTGWPGGTFVSYKMSAGPAAGFEIYLAENIDLNPALHAGSFVYSGTVLGTLVNANPWSESGWGVAGAGYTAEHACYTEGCDTALGTNFNELLVCLNAPSGVAGQTGCCTSTTGWPSGWCALLSAWQ